MITTQVQFYDFWKWLNNKDSNYYQYFTYDGAKALFEYLEEAHDNGEDINQVNNYDPIAWCVEFSEFDDIDEAYNQYHGSPLEGNMDITTDEKVEYFQNNTVVISQSPFVIADF